MMRTSDSAIAALRELDSPTVFNALVELGGLPNEEYTDASIRCLLPELGPAVGYAVTAEATTNDADSPSIPWPDYYEYVEAAAGPLVAVLRDVDSRPGRGACFGDGMATLHQRLGVVGAVVDGTVRDLDGIRTVGLPIWARGRVPGHGAFNLVGYDRPVIVGQLRVQPGDLLLADGDGCVRIPAAEAEAVVEAAGRIRVREADIFASYRDPDFAVERMRRGR